MNTTTPTLWSPTAEDLRVRALCRRFALSEALARLLAGLAYGECRE